MKIRRIGTATAVAAVAVAGVTTQVAVAKTSKVKTTCKISQTGPADLKAKCSGKPWGKFNATGAVIIPKQTYKFKLKGGTISLATGGGSLKGSLVSGGKWRVTKGTGKYKKAKGSGPYTLLLGKSTATFTGTIKY